jgi:hypothetical protein
VFVVAVNVFGLGQVYHRSKLLSVFSRGMCKTLIFVVLKMLLEGYHICLPDNKESQTAQAFSAAVCGKCGVRAKQLML